MRGRRRCAGCCGPVRASSLNGPIGPHRRWAWAHAQLSDVKGSAGRIGGTVNDVVLAAITRGLRRSAARPRRGPVEDDGAHARAGVGAAPGEKGTYNNRVSAMFAELPVGIEDPVERLHAVNAQMEGLKRSSRRWRGRC